MVLGTIIIVGLAIHDNDYDDNINDDCDIDDDCNIDDDCKIDDDCDIDDDNHNCRDDDCEGADTHQLP